MAELNVNLLPTEILVGRKSRGLSVVNKISIVVLGLLILISVATFYLTVSQSAQIKAANDKLAQSQNQLSQYKTTESNLVVLKQQLREIQNILATDSNRKMLFDNLITNLPQGVSITSVELDKNNNLTVGVSSTSLDTISSFLGNFTDDSKRLKQIKQVDLDLLNWGKDGVYKASLKVEES